MSKHKHTVSSVSPTGNSMSASAGLRPEWVRDRWFVTDDVGAIDAPEYLPAGGCYRYIPMFVGEPFPMQASAIR